MRQLNFYGFRKIKSDPLRLEDAAKSEETNFQKFKHDKFQMNRPDLLAEIRKSNHTSEPAEKQEVEALKAEVSHLRSNLAWVTDDMIKLKALVASLVKGQQLQQEQSYFPEEPPKKRKITNDDNLTPVVSEIFPETAPLGGSSSLEPLPITSGALMHQEKPSVAAIPQPSGFAVEDRTESMSAEALDQDVLASIFALDASDELSVFDSRGPPEATLSSMDVSKPAADNVDPALVQRLRDALSKLPSEMQVMFVDRITSVIGDPEGLEKQVDAMTRLAATSAEEAQQRLIRAGHSPDHKHFLPLASAVLGAYLARTMAPATTAVPTSAAQAMTGPTNYGAGAEVAAAAPPLPSADDAVVQMSQI